MKKSKPIDYDFYMKLREIYVNEQNLSGYAYAFACYTPLTEYFENSDYFFIRPNIL